MQRYVAARGISVLNSVIDFLQKLDIYALFSYSLMNSKDKKPYGYTIKDLLNNQNEEVKAHAKEIH